MVVVVSAVLAADTHSSLMIAWRSRCTWLADLMLLVLVLMPVLLPLAEFMNGLAACRCLPG